MSAEYPANAALFRQVSDLFHDVSDLVRSEIRLAQGELVEKVTSAISASVMFVLAGVLGFLMLIMLLGAAVFAIVSYGFAPHWAFLMVAAGLAVIALIVYAVGKSKLSGGLAPQRSVRQLQATIHTAKEQIQ